MTSLTELREQLAADLAAAGLPALALVPERVVPPVVVVEAGDPWVEAGRGYGQRIVRLNLFLIAGVGTNAAALAAVEDLIGQTLAAVVDPFYAVAAGAPYVATVNGYDYLTVQITAIAHDQTINA